MSALVRIRRNRTGLTVTCKACKLSRPMPTAKHAEAWRHQHLQANHVPDPGLMPCALCGATIPDVKPLEDDVRDAMSPQQRRTRSAAVQRLMAHGRQHGYQVGGTA